MSDKVTELQRVRFKVYHGGMGADPWDVLWVDKEWAAKAIASGIVEDFPPPPEVASTDHSG